MLATRSEKSERERLYSEINALGEGGGSITFSEKRVYETVSQEEWEALIAPKRECGWTFVLV